MSPPVDARRRVYNEQERLLIDPFKAAYMKTESPGERKTIAQIDIFPVLFTYWSSIGDDLNPDEMNKRTEASRSFHVSPFHLTIII